MRNTPGVPKNGYKFVKAILSQEKTTNCSSERESFNLEIDTIFVEIRSNLNEF